MKRLLLIILFMGASIGFTNAQSIDKLREQIRKAEQEIRLSNELLNKNKKDQKATATQLKLIRARITSRQEIINSLEKQIALINGNIHSKNDTVSNLQKELSQLKSEYALMLNAAYKNYKLNSFMTFLFASKDFNDATRRVAFMRRYNKMREEKAIQIDLMSKKIAVQIAELDSQKAELDGVKNNRNKELSSLSSDESQYKKTESSLKQDAGKLSKEVKEKERVIANAQKQIQRIIEEENKKAKAKPKTAAETKRDIELSDRFDQNKGKLPYPVSGGVIVDRFGLHVHSEAKTSIDNKGINIAAAKGAEVRTVFEGEVTSIVLIKGMNYLVMVRHGDYVTSYANLETVSVKKGDKVSRTQKLGNIPSTDFTDQHTVHFGIWKENSCYDPAQWLSR